MYGVDFAEDYELTERIGLGGSLWFGGPDQNTHSLSAAAFFADTTVLSESIFRGRGHVRRNDAGVSNTEDLSSFAISLDSESVPALGGIGYTLGISHQEGGRGDPEDETAFVAGLFTSIELDNGIVIDPLIEWVHQDNADAADQDRDYVTLGLGVGNGPWNLALSGTGRYTDANVAGGPDSDDILLQVSAGYEFSNGVTFDMGYRFSEESDSEAHILGVLLAYEFGFEAP